MRVPPDFSLEQTCDGPVCGVDEVGRGPWAGPVVAAAVVLDPNDIPSGIDDSKRLTGNRREALFEAIGARAVVAIGQASVAEIDKVNILQASHLAMLRAVEQLPHQPACALIDGPHIPLGLPCAARAIPKGDARSLSIAAASIIAKVTRDRIMVALSQQFPGYGWRTNVGYGTREHASGLTRLGVTPHHRRSFKPIHKILCEANYLNP